MHQDVHGNKGQRNHMDTNSNPKKYPKYRQTHTFIVHLFSVWVTNSDWVLSPMLKNCKIVISNNPNSWLIHREKNVWNSSV